MTKAAPAKLTTLDAMPLDACQQKVAPLCTLAAQIRAEVTEFYELTDDDRAHWEDRFRDGEGDVLLELVAQAESRPELVRHLAEKDHGHDPSAFEAKVLRERL